MGDDDILCRLEEFIRHYENKFWYGLAFFFTANILLIGAFVQVEKVSYFLKIVISIIGVFLTFVTCFFADDLRRYFNVYLEKYKERIRGTLFERIKEELDETKPCISQHCVLKILISIFLIFWLLMFLYNLFLSFGIII